MECLLHLADIVAINYDDVSPGFRQQCVADRMIHPMPEDNLAFDMTVDLAKSAAGEIAGGGAPPHLAAAEAAG